MKLNIQKTALVFGTFAGLMHAVWSAIVMLGFAQTYLDWVLGLHFLNNPFSVQSFTMANAVMLVGFTFVVGYAVGWVFATLWNKLHKK